MRERSDWSLSLKLGTLLWLLAVAYCILRNLKDAVVLTAIPSGAEIIPFLKVWGMLPASITFAAFFAFLSRNISRTKLFYVLVSFFLSYYILFAAFLYPNRENLRFTAAAELLTAVLPVGFKGFIEMIELWPVSSFYVMSEMWATTIMQVLFWGLVNESISTDQAKRVFGWIKIGATASALVAGAFAIAVSVETYQPKLPYGQTAWEQTFIHEMTLVIFLGLAAMLIFWRISPLFGERVQREKPREKLKMTLSSSLRYLSRSGYLIAMAVTVAAYNLAFNLSDILWKQQVKEAFPNPNDLMLYMNKITICVGIVSVAAVVASGTIVRRLGWTTLGMMTPVLMLTTASMFFLLWFFGAEASVFLAVWGSTPLAALLFVGALNNCLSKASKYSAFDVAKELAYTPLDTETKWNGKNAIDGIGNDIGKTGSSLVHQALLISFGGMTASAPWIAGLIFVVLLGWLAAVYHIGKEYEPKALVQSAA